MTEPEIPAVPPVPPNSAAHMHGGPQGGVIAWMASNPVAANLLMVVVLVAGLAAIGGVRKEVFPTFPTDTFTVTVPYPGAPPQEVEQGIIIKVEEALRDMIGIKEMRSIAREGVGVVTVEMEQGSDIGYVLNQAEVRVDSITSFPLDAEEAVVEEIIAVGVGMRVSLYGGVDNVDLKELGEQVRDEILQLPGISEISLSGDREYEISIEVSDADLRTYNLDFDQIIASVRNQSQDLPAGQLRTSDGAIKVRSVSQAYNAEDFSNLLLISGSDGTRISLGDIATVRDGFQEQPVLSLFNGEPAITLNIDTVGDQDVLQVTSQVRDYIERKQAELPEGVNIRGWSDESRILRGRIELMVRNAAQGALLVILALALFLNFSLAIWVIVGIPFSVLATLATIQFLGLPISINVLSVFAFILVLGILVDDGIVTAESAYARLEAERDGVNSIVAGVKRVATATVFGALTTAIAFGPSLFLTEGFARLMTHIGPVVMICVVFSLIETKLILPAHLRHIRIDRAPRAGWLGWHERVQQGASQALKSFAEGPYRRLLMVSVRNRYSTLATFVALLVVCIVLVPSGIVRFIFFPNVASDSIRLSVEMPEGTPWKETQAMALRIEAAALAMDRRFQEQDAEGRRAITEILVLSETDTSARVDLELLSSEHRSLDSVVLADWLREELGPVTNTKSFSVDANAGPSGPALEVQLQGGDLDDLRLASDRLKYELNRVQGVRDIRDSFDDGGRELAINVTAEGEALGLGDVELARQVRQAFFGGEIQRVQRGRHEVRVYVRLPESDRTNIESLQSMWVRLPDGRKVPFAVVGEARESSSISVINRIDRRRVVNVQADIDKLRIEPGAVTNIVTSEFMPRILDEFPGVSYSIGGQAEAQEDSSASLLWGLVVVVIVIFAALAIPLKSYVKPLIIMSVIPFGMIGAIVGHWLLGKEISMLSVIGIIGLVGVVVNDSLVLVDCINHYIQQGKNWVEAVLEAGPSRFRAVILTSITTFLGLLPIQLESSIQSEFVKPMAISLAFGVLFASFVTLLLVPTVYFIGRDIYALCRGEARVRI